MEISRGPPGRGIPLRLLRSIGGTGGVDVNVIGDRATLDEAGVVGGTSTVVRDITWISHLGNL